MFQKPPLNIFLRHILDAEFNFYAYIHYFDKRLLMRHTLTIYRLIKFYYFHFTFTLSAFPHTHTYHRQIDKC